MILGYFTKAAVNDELDPLEEDAWNLLAVENKNKISVEFDDRREFSNSFFLPSDENVIDHLNAASSPHASRLLQGS